MENRHEIGLDSYDRLFPNQDTMPKGGFGNLIALPLQKRPRELDNSVFLDELFQPHPDQWRFLESVQRMPIDQLARITYAIAPDGNPIGVHLHLPDEDEGEAPMALAPISATKGKTNHWSVAAECSRSGKQSHLYRERGLAVRDGRSPGSHRCFSKSRILQSAIDAALDLR